MVDCYLVGVSHGSAVDNETNNVTVFSFAEVIQLLQMPPLADAAGQPAMLPLEGHAYFEQEAEIERPLDTRLMWLFADGHTELAGELRAIALQARRMRVRYRGLRLPSAVGYLHLVAEWREPNSEDWQRSTVRWPFELVVQNDQAR